MAAIAGKHVVYTGTLSHALRRLKMLSLASCAVTVGSTPLLMAMESGISTGGKAALASVALLASCGSTGMIHYFTRPYIHKLYADQPLQQLRCV